MSDTRMPRIRYTDISLQSALFSAMKECSRLRVDRYVYELDGAYVVAVDRPDDRSYRHVNKICEVRRHALEEFC